MTYAANLDQVAYWNGDVGGAWARLQERMDRQLEPLGRIALAALAPRPGERILDVGCGCGATTLELARAVGPRGEVTGVDISAPMLAVARDRRHARDAAPMAFELLDAATHAFPAGAFDGVFSRFGVMFFAEPAAAFANLRRALAPGGRMAFVAWRPIAENPMFTAPLEAAGRHLPAPAPPADPHAPGPFGLADAGRTRALLEQAGFRDIAISPVDAVVSPGDAEAATALALGIGPLAALLRAHPQVLEAVVADLRAAFSAQEIDGRVSFPAAVWQVVAHA